MKPRYDRRGSRAALEKFHRHMLEVVQTIVTQAGDITPETRRIQRDCRLDFDAYLRAVNRGREQYRAKQEWLRRGSA